VRNSEFSGAGPFLTLLQKGEVPPPAVKKAAGK